MSDETAELAALTADLPNGHLVILPEQRHLTPFECPDAIADHILDFTSAGRVANAEVRHG